MHSTECIQTDEGHTELPPAPTVDSSDHISIMVVPANSPVVKIKRATQKTITVWPTEAVSMLQDCFETTEWQMFKEATTGGTQ